MKKFENLRRYFIISLLLIVYILFYTVSYANNISSDLGDSVFRLHVIANSDSNEDQNLKYLVRDNLINYMNNLYDDETFIKAAISHIQFESIHPYNDGNGRLGRALITLQIAKQKEDEPILFLSEIIELYKSNYYNALTECRHGNYLTFIKFFLNCIIEQCNRNIGRISKINYVYNKDEEIINNNIGGSIIHRLHPLMLKKIVFTSNEIANELGIHINSVNRILKKLIDLKIIAKEKVYGTNKTTYRYIKIYETFVSIL